MILDDALIAIETGDVESAIQTLITALHRERAARPNAWSEWVSIARGHSLAALLREDPFTRRAFEKPRGYAGDAELLDMIYDASAALAREHASSRGRRIFDVTACKSGSGEAVRERATTLAEMIDTVARRKPGARVLSVACGHLREARQTKAIFDGALEELVAFDQDETSLAVVENEFARDGVTCVAGSVRDLVAGRVSLGAFDCIYSAGLYDYLDDRTATKLTASLVAMLNPGGTFLAANFAPDFLECAYMECFMDWSLVQRDAASMRGIARRGADIRTETFVDSSGYLAFMKTTAGVAAVEEQVAK